jgi:hypothetical protein
LLHEPGPHLLVEFQDGWNWTDKATSFEHAIVTPLGTSFSGQAISVQWPQAGRTMRSITTP